MIKSLWIILFIINQVSGDKIYDKIIAYVNNDIITERELEEFSYNINIYDKDKALEKLIEEKLLIQEAMRKNISIDDAEVNEALASIKERFPTEEAYYTSLKKQNITEAQLKKKYKEELMKGRLLEVELHDKIRFSEERLKTLYENYDKEIRARHIVVKDKKLAEEILTRIKNGEDFVELAEAYSICPTKKEGGDLGYFMLTDMDIEFSQQAYLLNENNRLSPVIETNIGYHIIEFIDKRKAKKEKIIPPELLVEILKETIFVKKIENFIKKLKEEAYITYIK